jgi:hypothetical protein
MPNQFDREMDRLGAEQNAGSPETKAEALKELTFLKQQIESSRTAASVDLDLRLANESLEIAIKGQSIGVWRREGADLTLYRPGSAAAESHATSVADAAKMTARLVAAAGQA